MERGSVFHAAVASGPATAAASEHVSGNVLRGVVAPLIPFVVS